MDGIIQGVRVVTNPKKQEESPEIVDFLFGDERIKELLKITKKKPKDVDSWINLGKLYLLRVDFRESEKAFRQAILVDPKSVDAWEGLSAVYSFSNQYQSVLDVLKKLKKLNPKKSKEYGKSIAMATQLVEINNQESTRKLREGSKILAKLVKSLGLGDTLETVESNLRSIIEKEPKDSGAILELIGLLQIQGRFDESIKLGQNLTATDSKNVDAWLLLGASNDYKGNFKDAEAAFRKAIDLDPKRGMSWIMLGGTLLHQGKTKEALEAVEKGDFSFLHYMKGKTFEAVNQNKAAIEAYRESVTQNPYQFDAWIGLARVSTKMGDTTSVIEALENAVRIRPESSWVWGNLSGVLSNAERLKEAEKAGRTAIELDPNNETAWSNYIASLLNQKKYEKGANAQKEALELHPEINEGWQRLGYALMHLKKYDEAEKAFRKQLFLTKESAEAWDSLGRSLGNQERYKEAAEAFQKALKYAPSSEDIRLRLQYARDMMDPEKRKKHTQSDIPSKARDSYKKGQRYLSQKDLNSAEREFRKAVKIAPEFQAAWQSLSAILVNQNRHREAVDICRKILEWDPDSTDTMGNMGASLNALGQRNEAIKIFHKIVKIRKDWPIAWGFLANMYYLDRNYPSAEKYFRQAVTIDPNYADAWLGLGWSLNFQGREAEGKKAIEKALALNPNLAFKMMMGRM